MADKLEKLTQATRTPRRDGEEIPALARHFNPLIDAINALSEDVVARTTPSYTTYFATLLQDDFYDENQVAGPLTIGQMYRVNSFGVGDDFSNVGLVIQEANQEFIATGTTPTDWTHGTSLINFANPIATVLFNNTGKVFTCLRGSVGVFNIKPSDPITGNRLYPDSAWGFVYCDAQQRASSGDVSVSISAGLINMSTVDTENTASDGVLSGNTAIELRIFSWGEAPH
jgi:hypothetical protein